MDYFFEKTLCLAASAQTAKFNWYSPTFVKGEPPVALDILSVMAKPDSFGQRLICKKAARESDGTEAYPLRNAMDDGF